MATNYNSQGGRGALPYGWMWQFGIDPQHIPQGTRLGGGPRPNYYAVRDPNATNQQGSLSLNQNGSGGGTGGNRLPGWAEEAISGGPQGYNSQYESQLAGLLGQQAPTPGTNPATGRLMEIASQLQHFVPASQLPPSMQAALDRMKAEGLAGVEHDATRGASKLAGSLYDTTGGGQGTASDFLQAELAGEIGRARGGVESNYAQAFLNELNHYNDSRLSALQGAAGPLGAAGQLGEGDINRRYQSFYDQIGSKSSILSRLLQAERDRQAEPFQGALSLLQQGFQY